MSETINVVFKHFRLSDIIVSYRQYRLPPSYIKEQRETSAFRNFLHLNFLDMIPTLLLWTV